MPSTKHARFTQNVHSKIARKYDGRHNSSGLYCDLSL